MEKCQSLEKCPFFNDKMKNMPHMADALKKKYCLADFSICARYQVSKNLGKEAVPADLFPHQNDVAEKIIKESKEK